MNPAHRLRETHRILPMSSFFLLALLLLAGCAGGGLPAPAPPLPEAEPRPAAPATPAAPLGDETSIVEVTILHINDVYEITPVEGGRAGGLARVAARSRNPRAGGRPGGAP